MNMEKNQCVDPSIQQFRQELNEWFEQNGILDNLRSHLRSIMIAALQQKKEVRLRSQQRTTPRVQSMNLLVAEYLLRQHCHYTLSILMSELPSLANFATSGSILSHCGSKMEELNQSKEKYRFEENEVIEILNSLGVSGEDENLRLICDYYYNGKRNHESLLECLFRFIGRMQPEIGKRCENATTGDNAGVGKRIMEKRMPPGQFFSVAFEKKLMEEERDRELRELIDREKRIQDHLRNHEEEMLERLRLAEKELNSRRETIDRELSDRQLHLGRLAYQLKDKYSEILELSGNLATVKNENVILRSKLDGVEVEMNELRKELVKKSEIIEKLEAERMSMKCHVQEYLKWKKNREEMDGEDVTSNLCIDGKNYEDTEKKESIDYNSFHDDSQSSSSSSSLSSVEKNLLKRVKERVELLDQENIKISENYLNYKKKYENHFDESEIDVTIKCDIKPKEIITVVDAAVEVHEGEIDQNDSEEVEMPPSSMTMESNQKMRKILIEKKEEKSFIPTRRQQKHLEYFQKSRDLLEKLQKNSGMIDSFSSSCHSWSSKDDDDDDDDDSKCRRIIFNKNESGIRDLSDVECLTFLREATRSVEKVSIKGDEGG